MGFVQTIVLLRNLGNVSDLPYKVCGWELAMQWMFFPLPVCSRAPLEIGGYNVKLFSCRSERFNTCIIYVNITSDQRFQEHLKGVLLDTKDIFLGLCKYVPFLRGG